MDNTKRVIRGIDGWMHHWYIDNADKVFAFSALDDDCGGYIHLPSVYQCQYEGSVKVKVSIEIGNEENVENVNRVIDEITSSDGDIIYLLSNILRHWSKEKRDRLIENLAGNAICDGCNHLKGRRCMLGCNHCTRRALDMYSDKKDGEV